MTSIEITLSNGRSAPYSLYEQVRQRVEEIIPALDYGNRYTLEMLCGRAFWDCLDDGSRRTTSICMADMVREGILPLVEAESIHEYPKWYRLK